MRLKGIIIGCFAMFAVFIFPQTVLADISVSNMNVYVTINEDGSASVREYWDTYADEGTEFTLEYSNNGFLDFNDLIVTDKRGSYSVVEEWNDDASFDEKAGKCGIEKNLIESKLCFGISEYGVNNYIICYNISSFVGNYDDADGFLFRFANSAMSDYFPTKVSLNVTMADGTVLSEDNCELTLFGCEGYAQFDEDGKIVAGTYTDLFTDANFTLMARFDKGVFDESKLYSHKENEFDSLYTYSEADAEYLNSYFNDYYEGDDLGGWYAAIFLIGLSIAVFAGISVFNSLRNRKMAAFVKKAPYNKKCPKNINATYVLARQAGLCNEGELLGGRILYLMLNGAVKADISDVHSDRLRLELFSGCVFEDKFDSELFDILTVAADGDNIVHPREMQRFSEDYFEDIEAFLNHCEADGMAYLKEKGIIRKNIYIGLESLTEKGKIELEKICGFHKYLKDFSALEDKGDEIKEKWKDYLPYVVLFNLIDQYEEGLKQVFDEEYIGEYVNSAISHARRAYRYYGQVNESMEDGTIRNVGTGEMPE